MLFWSFKEFYQEPGEDVMNEWKIRRKIGNCLPKIGNFNDTQPNTISYFISNITSVHNILKFEMKILQIFYWNKDIKKILLK